MSDIGVGDWVECVQSRTLTVGALYCVEEVFNEDGECECHGEHSFGLAVVGHPTQDEYEGWCGLNFRPIYRPKQEIIEALKAPPKRVKERV